MSANVLPWWMPLSVFVWLVQMVSYHGFGYAAEYCDRNKLLRRYKVRDIDRKSYRQLMPRVLANQVFILLPCMVLLQLVGVAFTGTPHLPVWLFLGGMIVMGIGHDIVQYATHRYLLHQGRFRKILRHSVHHSTGASKGISACYMSAPDFFLEITLPYLLPLVLIGGGGSDVLFHCLVAGLGAMGGIYEHSGYDFAARLPQSRAARSWPRLTALFGTFISSHAHGQHHVKGDVSFSDGFGSPGVCDSAFGTRWDLVEHRRQLEAAQTPAE